MSRRFSDQPINLIHRIPTPEQLSAARPAQRSFMQAMVEGGAACIRGVADLFWRIPRAAWTSRAIESEPHHYDDLGREALSSLVEHSEPPAEAPKPRRSAEPTSARQNGQDGALRQAAASPATVQAEEIAELRGYLLTQQQDIARLAAQIQELKSLVISQQQVLLYLGKDLEQGALAALPSGVASGPSKRHRTVREKPGLKEKPAIRKDGAKPSSLSL